jgi:hypothetical protein
VEFIVSSLFPILCLPYITINSSLGRADLWLRGESSLCLLVNTFRSIILESVLFRIRDGVCGCANGQRARTLRRSVWGIVMMLKSYIDFSL